MTEPEPDVEHSQEYHYSKDQPSLEQSLNPEADDQNRISAADNCNVYVAGLPKRATEDLIRKEFSRFGTIQHVNLVRDMDTNLSKCFAYVMYATGVAANEAIRCLNKK
jgi:RNA recognition motif-containing protein